PPTCSPPPCTRASAPDRSTPWPRGCRRRCATSSAATSSRPRAASMTTGLRPAPPCTFVIFGASGYLTKRKLLPALYNLKAAGLLPRRFAIVGVTRKEKTHEEFREEQTKDIHEFATQRIDEALWDELRGCLYYQAGEFTDPATDKKPEAT